MDCLSDFLLMCKWFLWLICFFDYSLLFVAVILTKSPSPRILNIYLSNNPRGLYLSQENNHKEPFIYRTPTLFSSEISHEPVNLLNPSWIYVFMILLCNSSASPALLLLPPRFKHVV